MYTYISAVSPHVCFYYKLLMLIIYNYFAYLHMFCIYLAYVNGIKEVYKYILFIYI